MNTGNLYIPIVITENEHTIRDILNEVYVSNSDRKYIPVAALTDLSMEYDYKKIFGKKKESSCLFRFTIQEIASKKL